MKFAMPAAAVAALMLITTQGASAQPACNPANLDQCDDELFAYECLDEFNRSPAWNTCHMASAKVVDTQKCRISAGCQRGEEATDWGWSSVTVRHEDVHTLRNCSGTLQKGVC